MHVEWDTATECEISVLSPEDLGAEVSSRPYALTLGGAGGGCLAVEGTAAELRAFATRVAQHVNAVFPQEQA